MTSFKKETTPPARPPAPKLSLSKIKSRQHSTGSISIRFNASSMEDDYDVEDEIAMGTSPSEAVHFEVGNSDLGLREGTSKQVEVRPVSVSSMRNSGRCKSAPVSEVTTPVSAADSTSSLLDCGTVVKPAQDAVTVPRDEGEKSSLFSGIRERFQDPLTSLLEKVEEFSGESGLAEAIDRKLKVRPVTIESGSSRNGTGSGTAPVTVPAVGRHNGPSLEQSYVPFVKNSTQKQPVNTESDRFTADLNINSAKSTAPEEMWTRTGSFEIVDDFFAEPLDATDNVVPRAAHSADHGGHVLVKSNSSDQILRPTQRDSSQKPAKARQRVKKSKSKAEDEKAVSLSEILSNTSKHKDIEDALIEEEMFYDLDESKEAKNGGTVSRQVSQSSTQDSDLFPTIPRHRLIAAMVCLLAYLIIPLPTFVSGGVFGATLAAIGIFLYQWLTAPPAPREPFVFPDLEGLPPLQVPEMKESKNEDGRFKGWMNELNVYDPDNYHINQTQSVYVQLEGTNLRLQTPKQNVPKRSMWNEPQNHMPSFVAQRHLEVIGSKVSLLPEGLVKKRLWSKKYPICVHLGPSAHQGAGQKGQPDDNQASANSQGQDVTETSVLYLFARTGREKEEWFRRLDAAAKGCPLPTKMAELVHKLEGWPARSSSTNSSSSSLVESGMKHKRQGSADSNSSDPGRDEVVNEDKNPEQVLTEYVKFMAKIMPAESPVRLARQASRSINCEPVVLWANALVARGFWDFLREAYWAEKVKDKIQKKLSKIHVPYFIDELTVTGIELGRELPVIRRVSKPYINDRGLWVDMEVAYSGGFQMSLETKVNLMKLKRTRSPREHKSHKRSPVTDEEEEDSAESSTDDEGADEIVETTDDRSNSQSSGGNTSKKFLRFVDKIAASKYFQQATEYKYIKKAMEGVSNTRLMLSVELKKLSGTLAVNIPPPPTDRLWYGFRTNPNLWLSAKPKVGSREVSVSHITDWIEKKLTVEFQRVFVMPNMDDLPVPLLFDHITDTELHNAQTNGDVPVPPQYETTPQD